jgi:hypothetical protein
VRANDLHVLFVPLMSFYGLAFVLVLWSRLEIRVDLFRRALLAVIYLISALPFIDNFLDMIGQPKNRVQWPPYVPPYIAIMGEWTRPDEIITSDMPWGVAWYADRKSLWLPMTRKEFTALNDYNQLKGNIVGMYLTPVTRNIAFSELLRGEYKEWVVFIMHGNITNFPLSVPTTVLGIDNECIYYSDRDRWSTRKEGSVSR